MSEKTLRTYFVISLLANLWIALMWNKSHMDFEQSQTKVTELTNRVDSLVKKNDSLHSELFPSQVELGRYEVAHEIFMERNPKAASQYRDIISNETE